MNVAIQNSLKLKRFLLSQIHIYIKNKDFAETITAFYVDPNSSDHFLCFSKSSSETERLIFLIAAMKSSFETGRFNLSFGRFRISSGDSPSIARRILIIAVSLQTFVISAPE